MEKNMEHEGETGLIEGIMGIILKDDQYHLNRFDNIAYICPAIIQGS